MNCRVSSTTRLSIAGFRSCHRNLRLRHSAPTSMKGPPTTTAIGPAVRNTLRSRCMARAYLFFVHHGFSASDGWATSGGESFILGRLQESPMVAVHSTYRRSLLVVDRNDLTSVVGGKLHEFANDRFALGIIELGRSNGGQLLALRNR